MKNPIDEVYVECPFCGGAGSVWTEEGEEECEVCSGTGEVEKDNPHYREWLEYFRPEPEYGIQ